MKTRFSLIVAIAAMMFAGTAYGQYQQPGSPYTMNNSVMQQQTFQQQYQPQYQRPIQQPVQRSSVMQAPVMQNAGFGLQQAAQGQAAAQASPAPVANNGAAGIACDSACGANLCDSSCGAVGGGSVYNSACGAGCGNGRNGLFGGGGRLGNGCGGFGGGLGCGQYDPCCPKQYISGFIGAALFEDINANISATPAGGAATDLTTLLDLNDGWAAGGAIGRTIGRRMRGELEFAYRNASFAGAGILLNGVPQASVALDGQTNVYSFIPNILFDLNPCGRLNLYGGFGAGVAFVDLDATETTVPVDVRLRASSFAYQGIAGISARVLPRADLFLEYRYFGTDRLRLDASAGGVGTLNADVDITASNVFVGMRIWR